MNELRKAAEDAAKWMRSVLDDGPICECVDGHTCGWTERKAELAALEAALAADAEDGPLTGEWCCNHGAICNENRLMWNTRPFVLSAWFEDGRIIWTYGEVFLPYHPQTTRPARKLLETMRGE